VRTKSFSSQPLHSCARRVRMAVHGLLTRIVEEARPTTRYGCKCAEQTPAACITTGEPFGHFKGSNSIHGFVPYVSDAQIGTQRATVKSYLLATRYDGSNTWFFVDVGRRVATCWRDTTTTFRMSYRKRPLKRSEGHFSDRLLIPRTALKQPTVFNNLQR
jgi:hypothetical protein